MENGILGEIRLFAGTFAPRSWAFCDGQLLPIAQNTKLFSLLGTTYGGDGRSTFALPSLQGRVPVAPGRGPGLSNYRLGEKTGWATVSLSGAQIPSHNHILLATDEGGESADPINRFPAEGSEGDEYHSSRSNNVFMGATATTGGGQAHNNLQPFLAMNYVICLNGAYPSRS